MSDKEKWERMCKLQDIVAKNTRTLPDYLFIHTPIFDKKGKQLKKK